ncbi:unnamed protein product [Mytilus edulis]|uniref:Uncharacterized protein n=1 Tax=Mytilus edulis TaxID=6550 RepID=A0A8S3TF94_MYTED|nr:unnamed protein product [Mytilus edulis]
MPQPMNAHNGEAPLIEIAPEEIVQVHQPPNNENQAPEPLVPEPAPEPVQQIPEQQQQAPAHLIQAIQPTGTVPAQSHAAVPAQPPFQNQSNQQGHFGRSKPFQMPPPYMYTPVQQQSVQYRQPMQYPQQMRPQQNSYQNSRPNYANKQNEPCKGCGKSCKSRSLCPAFKRYAIIVRLQDILFLFVRSELRRCHKAIGNTHRGYGPALRQQSEGRHKDKEIVKTKESETIFTITSLDSENVQHKSLWKPQPKL